MSIRAKLYSSYLRRSMKNGPGGLEGLQAARSNALRALMGFLMRSKAEKTVDIGGMQAEWVGDPSAQQTLLYLHGGGYVMCGPSTHRSLVRLLCRYAGIRALIPDYRLAPEHPYPAAIEDAEKAYDYLLAEGVHPASLFLAGDSAGGGLSLALMQKLREHQKIQPRALALMSPWTDMTFSGASHHERVERDPMLDMTRIRECTDFYCADEEDKSNPLVSPLFANLEGFPPMFVQVGSEEILYDDATRLVENAQQAGVEARLQVWEGMPHVHQIAAGMLPESKAALRDIAAFFRGYSTS